MLHILLLIFKILLWIVLGLLGLILILVLLVLLAPIHYRAELSFHGGKTAIAAVKVRYLCVSFRINFDQAMGKLEQVIRILGIRLGKNSKDKKQRVKKQKKNSREEKREPETSETMELPEEKTEMERDMDSVSKSMEPSEPSEPSELSEPYESSEPGEPNEPEEAFDLFDDAIEQDVPQNERKGKGRVKQFLRSLWERIVSLYRFLQNNTPDKVMERTQEKLEAVRRKGKRLQKFWNMSCTVKTRAYLKKYIRTFFRHVLPRRVEGNIHYGMDEPYKTAKVTGYLSLMPFAYHRRLQFEPDFHNKVLELDVRLKGRITLGYLLRIVLNINLWRTIRVAKKVMSK